MLAFILLIISCRAIFLSPLAVFLKVGDNKHFWINIILFLLFIIPGMVFAFDKKISNLFCFTFRNYSRVVGDSLSQGVHHFLMIKRGLFNVSFSQLSVTGCAII